MRKVLNTLKLLFWGNLAVLVVVLYIGVIAVIGVTNAFYEALMGIWTSD